MTCFELEMTTESNCFLLYAVPPNEEERDCWSWSTLLKTARDYDFDANHEFCVTAYAFDIFMV